MSNYMLLFKLFEKKKIIGLKNIRVYNNWTIE